VPVRTRSTHKSRSWQAGRRSEASKTGQTRYRLASGFGFLAEDFRDRGGARRFWFPPRPVICPPHPAEFDFQKQSVVTGQDSDRGRLEMAKALIVHVAQRPAA